MRYIVILLISIFAISCGESDSPETQQNQTTLEEQQNVETEASASDTTESYTVKGQVKSLPPGGKFIIVHHEEIPGFMNAMEMPFNLEKPELVENVEPRDSVNFTFEVTSGKMTITELDVIE